MLKRDNGKVRTRSVDATPLGRGMGRNQIAGSGNSRGFSIIGWLIMIPAAILALLILVIGFHEGRKAYWDYRVKEMCKKDGGTRINETVQLDKQQYALLLNKFGQLSPPLMGREKDDVPVVHKFTSTYIRRANPEVRRDELAVIHKSNNAVLGISVSYSRVGGDLFALHPSFFACPETSANLFSSVVKQRKEHQ